MHIDTTHTERIHNYTVLNKITKSLRHNGYLLLNIKIQLHIIIIIRSCRQQRSVASTQSGHDDEPWTIWHES